MLILARPRLGMLERSTVLHSSLTTCLHSFLGTDSTLTSYSVLHCCLSTVWHCSWLTCAHFFSYTISQTVLSTSLHCLFITCSHFFLLDNIALLLIHRGADIIHDICADIVVHHLAHVVHHGF